VFFSFPPGKNAAPLPKNRLLFFNEVKQFKNARIINEHSFLRIGPSGADKTITLENGKAGYNLNH
jgi:hypothetical protein